MRYTSGLTLVAIAFANFQSALHRVGCFSLSSTNSTNLMSPVRCDASLSVQFVEMIHRHGASKMLNVSQHRSEIKVERIPEILFILNRVHCMQFCSEFLRQK